MLVFNKQFLKEAKIHTDQHKFLASSLHASEETEKEEFGGRIKIKKKSWKISIFSWLKADKKNNKTNIVQEQPPALKTSFTKSKTRPRGYVSGPINGIKGCTAQRPKRPTSGPLSGLFNQRKTTEEDEFQTPYISLGHCNSTKELRSFGPVYMVT